MQSSISQPGLSTDVGFDSVHSSLLHLSSTGRGVCPARAMISSPSSLSFSHSNAVELLSLPSLGIQTSIVSHDHPEPPAWRLDSVRLRYKLQDTSARLLPDFRVASCCRAPLPGAGGVTVKYHAEHQRASFGGLQLCGSVHTCPICSAIIGARRQVEIESGCSVWWGRSGYVALATFTLSHTKSDSLGAVLSVLKECYRQLKQGSGWLQIKQQYGIVGMISSTEYTYGEDSGWHPHLHVLMFLDTDDIGPLRSLLAARWAAIVARVSGESRWVHPVHGCDMRLAVSGDVSDYVTKSGGSWTAVDELVKSNRKIGRSGKNRTPAQLLMHASYGDIDAGLLYQEYASATFRRNVIVWSPGLRKLLGLVEEDKTDDQVVEEEQDGAIQLLRFSFDDWRHICRTGNRAEVLLAIERDGGVLGVHFDTLCTLLGLSPLIDEPVPI